MKFPVSRAAHPSASIFTSESFKNHENESEEKLNEKENTTPPNGENIENKFDKQAKIENFPSSMGKILCKIQDSNSNSFSSLFIKNLSISIYFPTPSLPPDVTPYQFNDPSPDDVVFSHQKLSTHYSSSPSTNAPSNQQGSYSFFLPPPSFSLPSFVLLSSSPSSLLLFLSLSFCFTVILFTLSYFPSIILSLHSIFSNFTFDIFYFPGWCYYSLFYSYRCSFQC